MNDTLVAVLEALPDGFMVFDEEQRIQYINQLAAQWLAVEPSDVVGQHLTTLPQGDVLERACLSPPGVVRVGRRELQIQVVANEQWQAATPAWSSTLILLRDATVEEGLRAFFQIGNHDLGGLFFCGANIFPSLLAGAPTNDEERQIATAWLHDLLVSARREQYIKQDMFYATPLHMHGGHLHYAATDLKAVIEKAISLLIASPATEYWLRLPDHLPAVYGNEECLLRLFCLLLSDERFQEVGQSVQLTASVQGRHMHITIHPIIVFDTKFRTSLGPALNVMIELNHGTVLEYENEQLHFTLPVMEKTKIND